MSDAHGPQEIFYHVAVRLEDYILVLNGRCGNYQKHTPVARNLIWMYNLYTEQWSKQITPKSELWPPNTAGACAIAIKEHAFLFGGYTYGLKVLSNELWKLSKSSEGLYTWCKETAKNMKEPSPRCAHSGWTYSGKLWIFGGFGSSIDRYLNDNGDFGQLKDDKGFNNQLLSFNPSCKEWLNLKCTGSVPSPRSSHASTIIGDKVWVYGGQHAFVALGDLYELSMSSLTWTDFQTSNTNPPRRYISSLNAISQDQLLLHGGCGSDKKSLSDTWILDLPSQTWKQYKSGDCPPRAYHTGSTGINSNSIIIGGGMHPRPQASVDDYHIMLEPKSLQQLAMQTIYIHQTSLPWRGLPKKLITLLGISLNDKNTAKAQSRSKFQQMVRGFANSLRNMLHS